MDYELAKQLKDAGFPQHERLGIGNGDIFINGKYGLMYVPTLSELIEACGGYVDLMVWNGDRAVASNIDAIEGRGSTPEEAVANLWLSLKNK